MFDNEFDPEMIEDDYKADMLVVKADTWLEQLEFIGSLMDAPDLFPDGWDETLIEPDDEFMQLSDECAAELEVELKPQE